jgi:hypothetical protein
MKHVFFAILMAAFSTPSFAAQEGVHYLKMEDTRGNLVALFKGSVQPRCMNCFGLNAMIAPTAAMGVTTPRS